jgi:hypothetical protein
MPAYIESAEARKYTIAKLSGSAVLTAACGSKFYSWKAPAGALGPYIVFHPQSPGNDLRAAGRLGAGRILTDPLYLIRAIAQVNDFASLEPLAVEIDHLFEAQTGSTSLCRISSVRERDFEQLDDDGPAQQWRHLGGLYRFTITGL